MARETGISSTTYDNIIYDAGAVYTGWTDFTTPGTLLGATRGGSSLSIEREIKMVDVDSNLGPVKGGRRIVNVVAKLTVNFIEQSLANLKRALVGSTSATYNTDWDAITGTASIADTDYLVDVVLVAEVSGRTGSMGCKLDNCIVDSNFELSLTDKEEGVIPLTFTAHFADTALTTEPWSLYYPNDT